MKSSFYLLMIILYLKFSTAYAQNPDTVALPLTAKFSTQNFPVATAKVMAANVLPFSVNLFIRKKDFSRVSWQSIGNNLTIEGWQWDEDKFFNNQFSHPYHGSFYFNAFRSEGYTYLQSAVATMSGSLLWEIAGEKDKASPNDLINTTLGGIAWGEMSHRLAMRFTHNWRTGRRKNKLDLIGIALDPMSALSALLSKKRSMALMGTFDTTAISLDISSGVRQFTTMTNVESRKIRGEWFTRLDLIYGSPNSSIKVPFDYFMFMVELGTSDSAVINIARVRGNLTGWHLRKSIVTAHSILLMLNYDYYNNSAFSYSMQSGQMSLNSNMRLPFNSTLQVEAGPSFIFLAAISDHEEFKGKRRNYDYCTGVGFSGIANLQAFQKINIRANIFSGFLHTLDGKNSRYRLFNSIVGFRYRISKKLFIDYDSGNLHLKSGQVDNHEQVKYNSYKRLSVGCQFLF